MVFGHLVPAFAGSGESKDQSWLGLITAGRRSVCHPRGRIPEHFPVPDAECLDPALLPEREGNKEAQLDQFRNREKTMELLPQRAVGDLGIPDDSAGVGQGSLLTLRECLRIYKVQEFIILLLR